MYFSISYDCRSPGTPLLQGAIWLAHRLLVGGVVP
eukprot:SAG11_NODE_31538_length_291_cov_0.770833_1_plen_34_part_01